MTEKEAMEQLKTMYPKMCKMVDGRYTGGYDNHDSKSGIAIDVAIKSLEKQIPKEKVLYEDKFFHCPCCDEPLGYKWKKYPTEKESYEWLKFCWDCGQALKW